MKTRHALVSNSSATSFCIYGTCIEQDPFTVEFIKRFKEKFPGQVQSYIDKIKDIESMQSTIKALENPDIIKDSDENFEWREVFDEMLPAGISINSNYYCGYFWFGRSWSSVGDEQTGQQFKDSIEENIKKLFGDNTKCGTYQEAWMG